MLACREGWVIFRDNKCIISSILLMYLKHEPPLLMEHKYADFIDVTSLLPFMLMYQSCYVSTYEFCLPIGLHSGRCAY